jgi:type IV pilus assembly protein PilM
MAAPYAWGIDIGNRALKAIRLSQGPAGLQIDDFDVVEHEQVLSNAGDNREPMLHAALASFVQRHELKGAPVAIGVSGQSSFARFIKLPPVEPRKIPEIVRFEAIQQIPFPLDEVEWSYQLFTDDKSPDVEVGIFAMRKELVNQHIGYFTNAGLNVQAVQMNPLAVYNAMYYDERIKGTTMMVDVGAENTDLIIAEGETIWLRSIPIGGNKFTEALAAQFKLKFPKAEELKRNAATSKYGRQILQAMKPVFNELVSEIQRSIGFYASVHRDSRISRVLALGGTFRLPGLQKYVQQNLQIEVQRIDHMGAGAPPDAKAGTLFNENILSAVSAYGLALQALGGAKINSSLLPQRIRREKMWREKTPWFGIAAAIFVAAPLLAYGSIYWGNHNLEANAPIDRFNAATLKQGQTLSSDWESKVEGAGTPDRTRAVNYQSLRQGRGVQNTLIADIANCLPPLSPAALSGDKTKMPPREQRQEIRIDRLAMDYHDDMAPFTTMDEEAFRQQATVAGIVVPQNVGGGGQIGRTSFGGGGGYNSGMRPNQSRMSMPNTPAPAPAGGGTAAPAAPAQRGFVIEIICTTPNAGGASFVLAQFVNKLKALTSTNPDVNIKVDKVVVPSSMLLKNDPLLASQASNPSGGYNPNAGGFGQRPGMYGRPGSVPTPATGAPTAAGQPTAPAPFDPLQDTVTGEDMGSDTRVTVRLSVLLDPPPTAPAPANGAVAQAGNP